MLCKYRDISQKNLFCIYAIRVVMNPVNLLETKKKKRPKILQELWLVCFIHLNQINYMSQLYLFPLRNVVFI